MEKQEKEIFRTEESFKDDFEYAVRAHEVIEKIVYTAQQLNDPCDFGVKVADILFENGLIPEAVYEVLVGAL